MSKLNRFRWTASAVFLVFGILTAIGMGMENPVLEAIGIVVFFVDIFLICIKNRCPDCKRSLPLHPPIFQEEEFCQSCGSKIE